MCGDCRYFRRHGRLARKAPCDTRKHLKPALEPERGTETLNRMIEFFPMSAHDIPLVDEWLAESAMSLD